MEKNWQNLGSNFIRTIGNPRKPPVKIFEAVVEGIPEKSPIKIPYDILKKFSEDHRNAEGLKELREKIKIENSGKNSHRNF